MTGHFSLCGDADRPLLNFKGVRDLRPPLFNVILTEGKFSYEDVWVSFTLQRSELSFLIHYYSIHFYGYLSFQLNPNNKYPHINSQYSLRLYGTSEKQTKGIMSWFLLNQLLVWKFSCVFPASF